MKIEKKMEKFLNYSEGMLDNSLLAYKEIILIGSLKPESRRLLLEANKELLSGLRVMAIECSKYNKGHPMNAGGQMIELTIEIAERMKQAIR